MRLSDQQKFDAYHKEHRLIQHPMQGDGYFVETLRDKEVDVDPQKYPGGKRALTTSIYYALTDEGISEFNQLNQTKYWQYSDGCPQKVYVLDEESKELKTYILGNPSLHGEFVDGIKVQNQLVIFPHQWVAAELTDKQSFSLMTCITVYGFDPRDFKVGNRAELLAKFPQYKATIEKFTPSAALKQEMQSSIAKSSQLQPTFG